MVGGADEDVARALPVLAACGTPVHLGPLGAGEVAKACNQMIVAATVLALGEAAVLADRSGLDLRVLFDLLGGGYAGSRILATRGERIVTEDYSPSGLAKYMVKDLDFATAIAAETDTHPVLLPAVRAGFVELVERGLGDFDMSVTRRFISQRTVLMGQARVCGSLGRRRLTTATAQRAGDRDGRADSLDIRLDGFGALGRC